ncbi:mitogen-activated protein kinase kinase kinase 4-like [Rhopilema esculentum]|uniref:mitogen-activated protein kinase kinase kinase 4-like n=1 Tax=Rhopilema esculentum TaxID=499914 RepID=UPI0031D0691B
MPRSDDDGKIIRSNSDGNATHGRSPYDHDNGSGRKISLPRWTKGSHVRQPSKDKFVVGSGSESSGSEKESDLLDQAEGIDCGTTPPRHIRRLKGKSKSCKKDTKVQSSFHVNIPKDRHKIVYHYKKEQKRAVVSHGFADQDGHYEQNPFLPRRVQSISIASSNRYRSIKSVPALLDKHAEVALSSEASSSISQSRSFGKISHGQDCPPQRLHFFKTFQLLVKLGDKHGKGERRKSSISVPNDENEQNQNLQIRFDQVLWLELQAWHYGRKLEEQDNYLLEERKNFDDILDEVINFHFPTALEKFEAMVLESIKKPTTSTSNSSPLEPSSASTAPSVSLPFLPHDVSHGCSTTEDHFTGSIQRKAMHIIIMLLKKVEDGTALYPTRKALSDMHPKYSDPKFIRNFETLNLWLNICKELYHKLQIIASLIDVDVDDNQTWEDWFDHGLGLTCIKTHKTYKQRKQSFRDDSYQELPSSHDVPSGGTAPNSPTSPPPVHKRRSVLKETTTSRYRSFVEKNIRQIGLNGLSRRIKAALHKTLWKARQALEVPAEAHDLMERQHNYGKVIDLVNFLEKTSIDDPSQKTVLESMVLHPEDFKTKDTQTHDRGVWSQEFSDMGLPSFLELYLFLTKIAFDILHESMRYHLDHRPKGDPSSMSIKQLINECKEVISGAIICKYYYQDMTLSALTADDKVRIDSIDNDINEFEEDVQSMLSVYFDYLQHLFQILQRLPEASRSLKNTMEDEWQFSKEICPHTKGLEAQAGRRFCVLATGLLDSTAHFLESSLDDCLSDLFDKMDKSSERAKDISLEVCRNHKKLFNEIRERAAKALGFAKMLQKDLGIAAEYKVEVSVQKIFSLLKNSGHVKVDCISSDIQYEVYTQKQLAADKRQILRLLNVTCGFEDPAEAGNSHSDGYIILLNLTENEDETVEEKVEWDGDVVTVSPTVDATIALANLQVEGLMVIACNSYQLFTQRIVLRRLLGDAITLVNEQTSSHQTIAEALLEFRNSAEHLAQGILDSVQKTLKPLNLESIYRMEQSEKALVHKNYVETMHLCFNTGFEYLRELDRLLGGQTKNLCPSMMEFAKEWMGFVCNNVDKGRGKKPRWSTTGLEFIVDACHPRHLRDMEENDFQEMKKAIQNCITHIYGHPEPALSQTGAASPGQMHRMKSHPGSHSPQKPSKSKRKSSGAENRAKFESHKSMSDSFGPGQATFCPIHIGSDSEFDLSPNAEKHHKKSEQRKSSQFASSTISHLDQMGREIRKLEKKRNDMLFREKIIGRVSDRKPDLASDLVNISSRRVNFKWHMGNKIGEGQFGTVYSCVNQDTGKLIAMKQIQFNPHDYSSIQDIADEITNIQSLQHESLVEYYGVEVHKNEMLIFMEYCEDGTIAEVSKIGLPEEIIRVYTQQIVKAVRFVHEHGIVHRDIKGANIFVSSSGLIKLGDFGSAVRLRDPFHTLQGEVCKTRGTPAFMAPEVINTKEVGYGRAADIWSLGCVVIEMVTGKTPWEGFDWFAIIYRVGAGAVPGIPESLSDEGKDFLMNCFKRDPKDRWTAEMLEGHHFVMCC